MTLARMNVVRRCAGRWMAFVGLPAALALLVAACGGGEEPSAATEGDRVTISLAVLDDVGRRASLYAIEQRIVTSASVDVVITYLPPSAIDESARSKEFDVIETAPLAIPQAIVEDFDFVVLSAGLQVLDGTHLVVSSDADLTTPEDLAGKTFGVVSREATSTLEARYLLQQSYGLDIGVEGDDVAIEEAPAQSLPTLLESGELDAALVTELSAFRLLDDADFRVLSRVTDEVRELTGAPVMSSLLVTYPDVAGRKADALRELNLLLAESVTYLKANQDAVIEAVAAEQRADPEFLRWWWDHYDLLLGDLSKDTQERLLHVWDAARALGDIESYPDLADVLFNPAAPTPTPNAGRYVP